MLQNLSYNLVEKRFPTVVLWFSHRFMQTKTIRQ